METLLTLIFVVFFIIVAVIAAAYFWEHYYFVETTQNETSFFTAGDGWRLAVHRYRPQGESRAYPVILCHGLNSNRYMFDLPGHASLARFLRDGGYDVWSADLRGSGRSQKPGLLWSDVPYRWGFDEILSHDVPAIVSHVLERTGAPKVHWVGHSMGGMLILSHIARQGDPRIASAVVVGSPSDFSKVDAEAFRDLLRCSWVLKLLPVSPLTFLGRCSTPLAHRYGSLFMDAFHPPNMSPETTSRVLALAAELVTSSQIWLDFGRFLEQGRFADPAGQPYLEDLPTRPTPILGIGGSADGMVAPDAVSALCAIDRQAGERECVTMGKAAGCREDYGHLDLMVGDRAHLEVFPRIRDWLWDHDGR